MRATHQRIVEILAAADEPKSTSQITWALESTSLVVVGRHLRDMRELGLVERVEAKPGGGTTWELAGDAE
jgi:DNA-binding transcriptional ArsR family regulator